MAIDARRSVHIGEARARRRRLGQYLRLDDSRYLLVAVVLLCLMSMLYLGQTGVVATRGYELTQLRIEQEELLREQARLHTQVAQAQDLERLIKRAETELGLRPFTKEQVRYIEIPPPTTESSE